MANTSNLREFQEAILHKLKEATTQGAAESTSRLGVMVGNQRMLVNLSEIIEVLPVPAFHKVPFTQPWFLGVANVRGVLYNITDLAQLMRISAPVKLANQRILLLNSYHATQSAVVVSGLLGLRNLADMDEQAGEHGVIYGGRKFLDASSIEWIELDIDALVQDETFIQPTL